MQTLLVLLALVAAASAFELQDNGVSAYEAFGNQINCVVTGMPPAKPRSLSFCHKFNDNACCAPVMDQENNEMFDTLMDLGLSCRLRGDVRDHPLAKLYCMNCDPQQPRYVRDAMYVPLMDGSPSPREDDDGVVANRSQTLLVSKAWAEAEFGTSPLLGRFDRCGVLKSSPCLDAEGTIIPDRDRYTCGDDLVVPAVAFSELAEPFENIEAFLNADSLGTPLLDESFGYLLVSDDFCSDAESQAEDNPRCLRTAQQVADFMGRPLAPDAGCTDATFYANNPEICVELFDEVAFNSSPVVQLSLVLLAACLALVMYF